MMAKFVLLEGFVSSLCCYVPKQSTSEETNFQLRATSPASVIRDSNIKDMTFIKHKCFSGATSLVVYFPVICYLCLYLSFDPRGTGTDLKNSIPNFWDLEWKWKMHSNFLGTGIGGCYCQGWLGTGIPAHHWMLVSAFAHVEVESGVVSGVNRSGWGLVWGGFWCLV